MESGNRILVAIFCGLLIVSAVAIGLWRSGVLLQSPVPYAEALDGSPSGADDFVNIPVPEVVQTKPSPTEKKPIRKPPVADIDDQKPETPEEKQPVIEEKKPDVPEEKQPVAEEKKPDVPEEKQPIAEEKKPDVPEEKQPIAEEKKPDVPEEKQPVVEEKKPDVPEEKQPVVEEKKPDVPEEKQPIVEEKKPDAPPEVREEKPKPPPVKSTPVVTSQNQPYALSMGVYQNKEYAIRDINNLERNGHIAYSRLLVDRDMQQALVGLYTSKDEAIQAKKTLGGLIPADAFPVNLPFALSVGEANNKTEAEKIKKRHRDYGYFAYIQPRPNGKYRVLVGAFASVSEAEAFGSNIMENDSSLNWSYVIVER